MRLFETRTNAFQLFMKSLYILLIWTCTYFILCVTLSFQVSTAFQSIKPGFFLYLICIMKKNDKVDAHLEIIILDFHK